MTIEQKQRQLLNRAERLLTSVPTFREYVTTLDEVRNLISQARSLIKDR